MNFEFVFDGEGKSPHLNIENFLSGGMGIKRISYDRERQLFNLSRLMLDSNLRTPVSVETLLKN